MSVFKRRRFPAEIVLLCVRWYCRYGISYRDLEEMMDERGVAVDHVTLYRWVQRYAPELEKRVRWYQGYRSSSWRVEADHGALKRLIRPTRGFQSMKTAYATIKGFEMMRMIRRRHCILIEPGVTGEVRFVNKLFDLAA